MNSPYSCPPIPPLPRKPRNSLRSSWISSMTISAVVSVAISVRENQRTPELLKQAWLVVVGQCGQQSCHGGVVRG